MPKYFLLTLVLFFLFITSLVVFFGVKRDFPVKYFSLAFLVLSLFFLSHLLWFGFGLIESYPHLIRTVSPFMFLPAPLLYLGLKQVANDDFRFKKIDFLHFIPSILHLLDLIPFYLKPIEEKKKIAKLILAEDLGWMSFAHGFFPSILVDVVRFSLMVGYFYFSLRLIFSDKIHLESFFQKPMDNWLKPTISVLTLIQVVFLIQYFFNLYYHFSNVYYEMVKNISIGLILLGIFFYIVFILSKIRLNLKSVEPEGPIEMKAVINTIVEFEKTKKLHSMPNAKHTKEDLAVFESKLKRLLEEESLYLDPNLAVKDLADLLNVPPRNLPEIFAELYGKTFKDVINIYRVNFAKSKIEENYLSSCTVDSLAGISGFNSRVTLYKVFKKEFSLSPSEYWRLIQKN